MRQLGEQNCASWRANAVLAAAGYNFRLLLLRWLALLLRALLQLILFFPPRADRTLQALQNA